MSGDKNTVVANHLVDQFVHGAAVTSVGGSIVLEPTDIHANSAHPPPLRACDSHSGTAVSRFQYHRGTF